MVIMAAKQFWMREAYPEEMKLIGRRAALIRMNFAFGFVLRSFFLKQIEESVQTL